MTNTRVILSIVGAFAAGAVLGVLLAPDKGSVLRSKIATTGKDAISNLNKSISTAVKDVAGSVTRATRTERSAVEQV